ncbi:hypothetical protein EV356DRAFT_499124 [Viridothelium virens]|uniref:FAD/NAD(P)-binding domain-containing protein n=1 Tax=Viridothelium virens TaxID=1048519 RepID=A0A6A6HDE8_VIRVR|nr:hypothetical protein EV356DRAFT_499124 [Viridothelium virens]
MSDSAEPLNVVVLGASFAGCAVAHHFLERVLPTLGTTANATKYRLVLVSPSTHIYWNIGAPRVLVSQKLISYEDAFLPIEPGFERYGRRKFTYIQAAATSLDTEKQLITLTFTGKDAEENAVARRRTSLVAGQRGSSGPQSPASPQHYQKSGAAVSSNEVRDNQTIPYHALVLATGSHTFSPLFTLQGPHEKTQAALDTVHRRIPTAINIVIAGGGPTAVETAGQIATFFRSKAAFTASGLTREDWKSLNQKRHITLISGTAGLLAGVDGALGITAEKQLLNLGVRILHNTRVTSASTNDGSDAYHPPRNFSVRTTVTLDNGTTLAGIDLYIPCTGVHPNTAYLPSVFQSPSGYANTDTTPLTLRLVPRLPDPSAGAANLPSTPESVPPKADRVYAVGDCASYSANYVPDVYDAIPVLMFNLANDLLAWELREAQPYGGNEEEVRAIEEADAGFTPRRAKPKVVEEKKEKKEKSEGPKKLKKRIARMTLMTPFVEASKKEEGEQGGGERVVVRDEVTREKGKKMSLAEAMRTTGPDGQGAAPALPKPVVDKSRWSGLSGRVKEGRGEIDHALSPKRSSKNAAANAHSGDLPTAPKAAARKGSTNDYSPSGMKADEPGNVEKDKVLVDTQLCPITRLGGVGVVFGHRLPSLIVWAIKGRDYRVGKGKDVVWNGNNPY